MEKSVSGKKVVILSLLAFVLFTAAMLYGTRAAADWLTPILRQKNAR